MALLWRRNHKLIASCCALWWWAGNATSRSCRLQLDQCHDKRAHCKYHGTQDIISYQWLSVSQTRLKSDWHSSDQLTFVQVVFFFVLLMLLNIETTMAYMAYTPGGCLVTPAAPPRPPRPARPPIPPRPPPAPLDSRDSTATRCNPKLPPHRAWKDAGQVATKTPKAIERLLRSYKKSEENLQPAMASCMTGWCLRTSHSSCFPGRNCSMLNVWNQGESPASPLMVGSDTFPLMYLSWLPIKYGEKATWSPSAYFCAVSWLLRASL